MQWQRRKTGFTKITQKHTGSVINCIDAKFNAVNEIYRLIEVQPQMQRASSPGYCCTSPDVFNATASSSVGVSRSVLRHTRNLLRFSNFHIDVDIVVFQFISVLP